MFVGDFIGQRAYSHMLSRKQETDVPEEEERSLNGPECPSPVLA